MDSCPGSSASSSLVSEESDYGWDLCRKEKKSAKLGDVGPKNSSGIGYISPDGTEWSTDKVKHAKPRVHAQEEARPLLHSASRQSVVREKRTQLASDPSSNLSAKSPPRTSSLPVSTQVAGRALERRPSTNSPFKADQHPKLENNKQSASSGASSHVSESSDQGDSLPTAKTSPPKLLPRSSINAATASPQTKLVPAPAQSIRPKGTSNTVKSPAQNKKRPATNEELHAMGWRLRKRAMNTYDADQFDDDGQRKSRFDILFTDKGYEDFDDDSKHQALMGYVFPICSRDTSEQEQRRYSLEVSRLYALNKGQAGADRLNELERSLSEFKITDERERFRFKEIDNLVWQLTPNQRHGLREQFKGLYGNSVLRDDTNWMFFDTIIRLYTKDEKKQRGLMEKIFSASEETRLQERDELRDIIHDYLTPTQREYLKSVCKQRHDAIQYTRLPLFQMIIRENNDETIEDYISTVMRFTKPSLWVHFLTCRNLRMDPATEFQGESAFFSMVHWSSIETMSSFLQLILFNKYLTIKQKNRILTSHRIEDDITPFHMIMAAGDYKRARAVLREIINYFKHTPDWLDSKSKNPKLHINVDALSPDLSMYKLCIDLLAAAAPDETRLTNIINGYTRAFDSGHKKMAKRFKVAIQRQWLFLMDDDRWKIVGHNDIYNLTKEEDERRNAEILAELKIMRAQHLKEKYPDKKEREIANQKWEEGKKEFDAGVEIRAAAAIAEQERVDKGREKAAKEGRRYTGEMTRWETFNVDMKIEYLEKKIQRANYVYYIYDAEVGRENLMEAKRKKRKENPTPLKAAAKKVRSLFGDNQPEPPYTPKMRTTYPGNSPSPLVPDYKDYVSETNDDGSPKLPPPEEFFGFEKERRADRKKMLQEQREEAKKQKKLDEHARLARKEVLKNQKRLEKQQDLNKQKSLSALNKQPYENLAESSQGG